MCYLVDRWSVRQGLFREFFPEMEVVVTSADSGFLIFEIPIIICISKLVYQQSALALVHDADIFCADGFVR